MGAGASGSNASDGEQQMKLTSCRAAWFSTRSWGLLNKGTRSLPGERDWGAFSSQLQMPQPLEGADGGAALPHGGMLAAS